jgi:hypothetical protein
MYFFLQSIDSRIHLVDLVQVFLKGDLLRTILPFQRVYPLSVFRRPIADSLWCMQTITQQELGKSVTMDE